MEGNTDGGWEWRGIWTEDRRGMGGEVEYGQRMEVEGSMDGRWGACQYGWRKVMEGIWMAEGDGGDMDGGWW